MRPGRLARAVALFVVLPWGCTSVPRKPVADLTPAEWRSDLRWVVDLLEREHPALFGYHGVDSARFAAETERLERSLDRATTAQILFGLDRLVAMVGDGHTSLDAVQPVAGLSRYPLRLAYFGDELRVYATPAEATETLGAEVVTLDGMPVAEVFERAKSLISRDTDSTTGRHSRSWASFATSPSTFAWCGPSTTTGPGGILCSTERSRGT